MPLTPQPQPPDASGYNADSLSLIAMNYDPALCTNTGTSGFTAGTVYSARVMLRRRALITNVVVYVFGAGGTLTANQCLAALYDPSGNLLSTTGNQATAWASIGTKTMALGAAQDCVPGAYDVAWFYNGTTQPSFFKTDATIGATTVNLSGNSIRWASTNSTGRTTTMPSTIGTKTALAMTTWVGLS